MRTAGFDVDDPADDAVTSGLQCVDRRVLAEQACSCSRSLGVTGIDDATQKLWREYQQVPLNIHERGYPDFPSKASSRPMGTPVGGSGVRRSAVQ